MPEELPHHFMLVAAIILVGVIIFLLITFFRPEQ